MIARGAVRPGDFAGDGLGLVRDVLRGIVAAGRAIADRTGDRQGLVRDRDGATALAPHSGAMTEHERLRHALDGYAADDIRVMLEGHSPGAGAARRKSERIDQLTRLLADPAFARRAASALSPLGRRALGIVRRYGRTS
ncbi:MAG TPA: hypothetical protein VFW96_16625, partial [Thermomicrobiales bacterium]|nr:hypothetical protein [Thermomicrobiales bacterium]